MEKSTNPKKHHNAAWTATFAASLGLAGVLLLGAFGARVAQAMRKKISAKNDTRRNGGTAEERNGGARNLGVAVLASSLGWATSRRLCPQS